MKYRALNLWRKKFDKRSEDEQFLDLALLFYQGQYTWGKENLEKVDCSGLISGVLALMGYPIRTTADDFMKRFFTKKTSYTYRPNVVKAVFFVSKDNYQTPSGEKQAGNARHVGILIGEGIIFHAVSPLVCFERLKAVQERYDSSDMVIKEIDWDAIKADEGKYAYDVELQ